MIDICSNNKNTDRVYCVGSFGRVNLTRYKEKVSPCNDESNEGQTLVVDRPDVTQGRRMLKTFNA